ncbi:MAG: hypothetical protein GY832_46420 [Chloroflexi bacterium]|nr:hypothetical protein [Chloroflexota bacterium]
MTPPGQTRERRRGSGFDHTVADQQARLDDRLVALALSAFANGGTWMDNGPGQVDSCGNLWTKNNALPPSSRPWRERFHQVAGQEITAILITIPE